MVRSLPYRTFQLSDGPAIPRVRCIFLNVRRRAFRTLSKRQPRHLGATTPPRPSQRIRASSANDVFAPGENMTRSLSSPLLALFWFEGSQQYERRLKRLAKECILPRTRAGVAAGRTKESPSATWPAVRMTAVRAIAVEQIVENI